MFEVSVSGRFAAAHQLRLSGGTLEPLHTHDWRVTVTFAGSKLDGTGVLLDFAEIQPRVDELLATLHDRRLNDLPAFARRNPSAENVALHIAEQLGQGLPTGVRLRCVEVEEEPGRVARYRPGELENVPM
ncbi:MAG: 6-pyruvoyl tetrahydropterin synthase family protein [Phycisphaerae bacterium]